MIGKRRLAAALLLIAAFANTAFGQATFRRWFWAGASNETTSVERTSDGGYIAVGNTTNFAPRNIQLLKLDRCGRLEWMRDYWVADKRCTAQSVRQTRDGGYIIGGETDGAASGTCEILLIKTDATGDINPPNPANPARWVRAYEGTGFRPHYGGTVVRELAHGGGLGPGGGYVAIGRLENGSAVLSGVGLWVSSTGAVLCEYEFWDKRYLGAAATSFNDVRENSDRYPFPGFPNGLSPTYTMVGWTSQDTGKPEVLLTRMTRCGTTIPWTYVYGPIGDRYFGEGLERCANGDFVITGRVDPTRRFTLRTDLNGVSTTGQHFVSSGLIGRSIREQFDENLLVGGHNSAATDGVFQSLLPIGGNSGLTRPNVGIPPSVVDTFEECIQGPDGGILSVGKRGTDPNAFHYLNKTDVMFALPVCPLNPRRIHNDSAKEGERPIELDRNQLFDVASVPMQVSPQRHEEQVEHPDDCVDCGCAALPVPVALWLPFDGTLKSKVGQPVVTKNVAGPNVSPSYNGELVNFTVPSFVPGQIGKGLCFDGVDDYVEVADYNAIDLGKGNFTIDFWINAKPTNQTISSILDKRIIPAPPIGYHVFIKNPGNLIGIQLTDEIGPGTNYYSSAAITPGSWNHVAITCVRTGDPSGLRFYVNGQLLDSQNPSVEAGSLTNAVPLTIGTWSGHNAIWLPGCLDDLEVHPRALTAAEVFDIWDAGDKGHGKCQDVCELINTYTPYPKNPIDPAKVTARIHNYSSVKKNYDYWFQTLPIVPRSNVAGPVLFTPASGTILNVPAYGVADIAVDIPRSNGINTWPKTGAYQLFVQEKGTPRVCNCRGFVGVSFWNIEGKFFIPAPPHEVQQLGPIEITNDGESPRLDYRIMALHHETGEPDTSALSLDGQDPGTTLVGSLDIQPGETRELDLTAEFVEDRPLETFDIVILADVDGDEEYDPLWSMAMTCVLPPLGGGEGNVCQYKISSSKSKGGCETCPQRGDIIDSEQECQGVNDCAKKLKTSLPCPDGPGECKIKAKRDSCGPGGGEEEVTIDFQVLECSGNRNESADIEYSEDGYKITREPNGEGGFSLWCTGHPGYPGSTSLWRNFNGRLIVLQKLDNAPFTLKSIKAAELGGPGPAPLNFVGTKSNGDLVRHGVVLDGVGPQNGLEQFNFPPEFTDLVKVEWRQEVPGHQFDDIVVSGR